MVGVVQRQREAFWWCWWCRGVIQLVQQQSSRERANEVGGSQAVYNRRTVQYGKLPSAMVRSGGREGSCLGVV